MKNQLFHPPSINYTSCSRCCINHTSQPPIKNILHQSSSVPSSAIHQLSGVVTLLHDASHRPIVDQPFYLSANIRHPSPTRDIHDAAIIIPPDHVSSILYQSSSVPSSAIHQLSGVFTLLHIASHRPIIDQPLYQQISPIHQLHEMFTMRKYSDCPFIHQAFSTNQAVVSHPSTIWGASRCCMLLHTV